MLLSKGPQILFVNKCDMKSHADISLRRCVSTVVVKGRYNDIFYCITYDEDLIQPQKFDILTLFNSWNHASDNEELNGCYILVQVNTIPTIDKIIEFAIFCMKSSFKVFSKSNCENIYYGLLGLEEFSHDILSWRNQSAEKFIDCAMYLNMIINQRKCFYSSVTKILEFKNIHFNNMNKIESIVENWERLRMLMYIVGKRNQTKAVNKLQDLVNRIIVGESEYINTLTDLLGG